MTRKLILFELNEVPRSVLDAYAARHPGSAVARLLSEASALATRSHDAGRLSPWITWPTVHRGVTNDVHGISHFGQDTRSVDERFPPLWAIAARAGLTVGVGASLHAAALPDDRTHYAFFLPHAFAESPSCHPPELEAFQALNLEMTHASGRNVSRGVPRRAALRLARRWRRLGLTARTFAGLLGQLLAERRAPHRIVRRRGFQGLMSFEVVMAQIERTRPDLATCFTNHVASSMHRYWAAAWPDQYEALALPADWIERHAGEIDFAMRCTDVMVGRLLDFIDRHPDDYALLVAGSMGQAAYHHTETVETELRVVDGAKLLAALGFGPGEWEPRRAMAPQFHVQVDPRRAGELDAALADLWIDGHRVGREHAGDGLFNIIFAERDLSDESMRIELAGEPRTPHELGLANVVVQDGVGSTAYHVPEGVLLVHGVAPEAQPWAPDGPPVPTHEIAPFVLAQLGLPRPPWMTAPGAARSSADAQSDARRGVLSSSAT